MGLNNQYVGETEVLPGAGEPPLYSRLWVHRFANRQGSAYTNSEARELGGELKQTFGAKALSDDEIVELLDEDKLDLSGALGRNLEDDEEEFLEENSNSVVIDV